jgi:hypothetical protein
VRKRIVAEIMHSNPISLAVWDAPLPVIAGDTFSIKAGAKSASGHSLAGHRVEVFDASGIVVASGNLGQTPLAGTEALYWTAIDVPAPATGQVTEYAVRFIPGQGHDAAATRFSVAVTARPEHKLTIKVTEQSTAAVLGDVEIRLGPFHARTDAAGHAELRVCKGEYQLHLWRAAHIAPSQPIRIDGDASVALTMAHVPEEHPDARWVR